MTRHRVFASVCNSDVELKLDLDDQRGTCLLCVGGAEADLTLPDLRLLLRGMRRVRDRLITRELTTRINANLAKLRKPWS